MWVASLLIFEQGGLVSGYYMAIKGGKARGEMMLWNQEGGGDSSGTHLTFCLETSVDDSNIVHSTQ